MFAEPQRQLLRPTKPPEEKPLSPLDKARSHLKAAEASALQADTWLKEVIRRVSRVDFDIDDVQYLRGLLGSEKFEEGSVQFLDSVLKATQQGLEQPNLTSDQREQIELNVATAEKLLEALGLRLTGLKLMLNGPKPLVSTPPAQA